MSYFDDQEELRHYFFMKDARRPARPKPKKGEAKWCTRCAKFQPTDRAHKCATIVP